MKDNTNQIHLLVGPFTILLAFLIATAVPFSFFPYDLFVVAGAGLFLTARFHVKGCSYALILLATIGLLSHLFLEEHHVFRLLLEGSLLVSFVTTALSFEETMEFLNHIKSQLTSHKATIQNLEEEALRTRETFIADQIASQGKINDLQKSLEEIQSDKNSLEMLNDVLRKSNAKYFEEQKKFEKILTAEKEKWSREAESLRTLLEDERMKKTESGKRENELQEALHSSEEKISELIKIDFLYKQLRGQFEEKTQILHETRSALFKMETDLQTIRIEQEQNSSELSGLFDREIERLEQEIVSFQEENERLQDLVTTLTTGLSETSSFVSHRTPLPAGQVSLQETLRETLLPPKKKKAKKTVEQDLLF